jgi:hypothetical protein
MMRDREEDQQRAMGIAGPILPGLHSVLADAVAFYFSDAYSDRARAEHTSTAVANNIYSHAEKRVLLLVEQTPGLSIIDIRALRVANIWTKVFFGSNGSEPMASTVITRRANSKITTIN